MKVNSIESPAIVYNLQHFWLLYTMTGYSIEWPIIHIDRNIYIEKWGKNLAKFHLKNLSSFHKIALEGQKLAWGILRGLSWIVV